MFTSLIGFTQAVNRHIARAQNRSLKRVMLALALVTMLLPSSTSAHATAVASNWSTKLDGEVRFYQLTELGVLVAGTERSLYAVDGETGDVVWRRKGARLDEREVAPIPGTDLVLLSFTKGDRTRVEAVDLLTGNRVWQSERVRGAVMQMAVDLETNLLAAVFTRDARERARSGFKRKPTVHVFDLSTGDELWKRELESEVEMMPTEWSEREDREVEYTLDNYRPPLFLDGRLYLFYEGLTSLDARSGKGRMRERFRVNEEGLALTEADPVFDERLIYTSGRGRVRAISRDTGEVRWEAKDLGLTPQMMLTNRVLYVRTGGQFTRVSDGETAERGPYGVSAIDAGSGKTLWHYKGADKGITNIALLDPSTLLVADRDDLIAIDVGTGKRRAKISHEVERAGFVLINEAGQSVVGGRNELAAFDVASDATSDDGSKRALWRARHNPPGRGILRTVAAVAARSASLYFRYAGAATTVFGGVQLARTAVSTLRWSGLAARASLPDLTTLASGAGRQYVTRRIVAFGAARRIGQLTSMRGETSPLSVPQIPRPSVDIDVEDRLLDRLDPSRQLDRLSR
ncbi:MAG: PQQ-binding-like beta-propeller repeat protein, partial [Pyrinomonadaceae bacterium]|nr:PQQ-binding-like beta-propeller repeat protein [Pyrinomonadaceae bacterium]